MGKYRVLALDGGGSWALILAMALIDLYGGETNGHDVLRTFDMAAANSGGSIVLGCLVENMKLGSILDFFLSEQMRKSVFVEKLHLPKTPKYVAADKLEGLLAALPQRGSWFLPEAARDIRVTATGKPIHLLITSFDYDRNKGRFFRSQLASGPAWGDGDPAQVRMAEAIHASSNAPVLFFDKPAQSPSEPGKRYWDGAISGCNNPVLAAVTEAVVLGHAPDRIAALSIGTGTVCRPQSPADPPPAVFYAPREKSWYGHDVLKMATAIVDDPPDAASFVAHVLTRGSPGLPKPVDSRIVRMNPMVSPVRNSAGEWDFPNGLDAALFERLANLAMDAVTQADVNAIQTLASLWLQDSVRNQPIRMDADLNTELGQYWYRQAKEAWQAVRL